VAATFGGDNPALLLVGKQKERRLFAQSLLFVWLGNRDLNPNRLIQSQAGSYLRAQAAPNEKLA